MLGILAIVLLVLNLWHCWMLCGCSSVGVWVNSSQYYHHIKQMLQVKRAKNDY
jgi:hypothetical protein